MELVIEKGDNSYKFVTDAGGGPQQRVTMELTLDGYSAPLTAGNFAANVKVLDTLARDLPRLRRDRN